MIFKDCKGLERKITKQQYNIRAAFVNIDYILTFDLRNRVLKYDNIKFKKESPPDFRVRCAKGLFNGGDSKILLLNQHCPAEQ